MVIYLDFICIFVGKSENDIDTNGNTKGNDIIFHWEKLKGSNM